MARRRATRVGVLAAAALTLTSLASAPAAYAGGHDHGRKDTFAVIGDIPYGAAEIASFPADVAQINADPKVSLVVHLGDIKNGSSECTDAYFSMIRKSFDQFRDPLVYTIGDNEWTDCHRPNNGSYDPLERLDAVRSTFFDRPGLTLGQRPLRVDSDASAGFPENVSWTRDHVAFTSVHIVGSNNGLAPRTGATTPTPEQTAEVLGRTADTIVKIRETFARAKAHRDRAVVLMTQADMFDPTVPDQQLADYFAFKPIVAAIAEESAGFGRPVYLFNGDSHIYNADQPLAPGSSWLGFYGVGPAAPNLTRVTVDGSDNAKDYLRVTITKNRAEPLTWTRVPFTA
jgi:hypothetical protein